MHQIRVLNHGCQNLRYISHDNWKMIKCFQGNSIKSRSSVQDGQTESAEEEQWFLTVVDDRR